MSQHPHMTSFLQGDFLSVEFAAPERRVRTPEQDQALLDAIEMALEGHPPLTLEEIQAVPGEWG